MLKIQGHVTECIFSSRPAFMSGAAFGTCPGFSSTPQKMGELLELSLLDEIG
jgi:hypothetical protein